ncbi:MAG: YegS/Rv2252/BmrU family lipid kinase [Oscillospiraceae bacterium]|nr:YegS/Rv2252/BmrU family lipid kinase [Oscillospiraceae bacterium]
MSSALLIYNPNAGRNRAAQMLDTALAAYQKAGWVLDIKRSNYSGDIAAFFGGNDLSSYDAFIVMGGDGTLNEVINGMAANSLLDKPLGIVSCGTVNDFARYLQLPSDPCDCFDLFLQGSTRRVDLGCVNEQFFINVCAVGMFSHGYMSYDPRLKKTWGRAAYYTKGVADSINFKPALLRIEANGQEYCEKFQLVLALNSTGTGGFHNISRQSTADDGVLDIVAVKAVPAVARPALLVKAFNGEIVRDKNVLYFQTAHMKIEMVEESSYFESCDLDGDRGPALPIEMSVNPAALMVYCP